LGSHGGRAYLAQSDIFVGLYWQRYGWIGPDMDISGLEDEFRLSGSIPRLLYVKSPPLEREPRLTAMIDELQSEGADSYRQFHTPRELARLVRDDLALLLSERFTSADRVLDAPAPPPSQPAERSVSRSLPLASTSLIGRARGLAGTGPPRPGSTGPGVNVPLDMTEGMIARGDVPGDRPWSLRRREAGRQVQ
jgi:hypothetical protein